jgi:hypothetical protein
MPNPMSDSKKQSRNLLVKEIEAVHAELDRLDSVIDKCPESDPKKSGLRAIRKAICDIAVNMKKYLLSAS